MVSELVLLIMSKASCASCGGKWQELRCSKGGRNISCRQICLEQILSIFFIIKELCKHLPSSKAAYFLVWEAVLGSEKEFPAEELVCREAGSLNCAAPTLLWLGSELNLQESYKNFWKGLFSDRNRKIYSTTFYESVRIKLIRFPYSVESVHYY